MISHESRRKKLAGVGRNGLRYTRMRDAGRAYRAGSIAWSVGVAAVVIVLGGSALLPSTKRAHFRFEHGPATLPADPATQPHANEPPADEPHQKVPPQPAGFSEAMLP